MLRWSLTFFILAMVAGLLGFGGGAASLACIAKVLFFIFITMLLVFIFKGLLSYQPGHHR